MIDALRTFTETLPDAVQWLGLILLGAIPFVESYFSSLIGVVIGVHPVIAVAAAVVGNVVSMLIFVVTAHGIRTAATKNREQKELSPRREKLKARFDRYGVAGVSLLGQAVLPSQITSALIVSFGAPRNKVIFWQIISIILWGVLFAVLASLGIEVAGRF
ncbi:small multi-drug export protein [Microbacterium halotolerans]|uniref:small multi-drug export protein n=1 Tax=Microbacterium halotolerans TaxID=246613 RepID=UPI000E6ACC95|nr:small multi-drug export protein [Microbacterium halotolerans]